MLVALFVMCVPLRVCVCVCVCVQPATHGPVFADSSMASGRLRPTYGKPDQLHWGFGWGLCGRRVVHPAFSGPDHTRPAPGVPGPFGGCRHPNKLSLVCACLQVTAVFCQSAIESAQKDHATVVQNMLDNKESHLQKLAGNPASLFYWKDFGSHCATQSEILALSLLLLLQPKNRPTPSFLGPEALNPKP